MSAEPTPDNTLFATLDAVFEPECGVVTCDAHACHCEQDGKPAATLTLDLDDDFVEFELEEPVGPIELRPYQLEAIQAITNKSPFWRKLLVLGTGGGKTIIFGHVIKELIGPGQRVLVLAHRDELIDQATEKIGWCYPGALFEREKATQRASRTLSPGAGPTVVVASVQSLHAKRLAEFPRNAFDLIICDETHHATEASYRKIFEHFGCFDDTRRTPLLGVTATPDRSDKKSLSEVFQVEAYRKDIAHLIREGWLCDIRARRVNSQTDLSDIAIVNGDFDNKALAEVVDSAERNALVVQSYIKFANTRNCVVFAASVAHAQRLAELFNQNGVPSAAIYGDLDKTKRKQYLKDFHDGKLRVLCNCMVLVEGWDEASVACLILARPTRSHSLLLQILGRGTRLFDGKEYLLVLDIQDKDAKGRALTVGAAFGLPPKFNADDISLSEAGEMMRDIDPGMRDKILDQESLTKIHARVKEGLDVEEIDILQRREAEAEMRAKSTLRWRPSGDGFVLYVTSTTPDNKKVSQKYQLERDSLGNFRMHWISSDNHRVASDTFTSEQEAFTHWDTFIEKRHADQKTLIRNDAKWLSQPASPKQIESLFAFGVIKAPNEIPPELTKDEAGVLLDRASASGAKYNFRRVPFGYRTREVKPWKGPHKRKLSA